MYSNIPLTWLRLTKDYHGSEGYLSVGYPPYRTKLSEYVVKAALETGMNYVDYDGKTQVGVSYLHLSIKDGTRHSSSMAYLHPAKRRNNLHFRKRAMVKRVIIDPIGKQTVGVEVVLGDTTYTLRTKKEVILAAGSINSPQLLMLSGVGPKNHLKQMEFPVIQNLKVGYNLMNHVTVGGLTFLINENISIRFNHLFEKDNLENYLLNHKGPLTLPGGSEVLTFTDFQNLDEPNKYYFAHREDLDTLIQGIRQAINVSRQPALQSIGTRPHKTPILGCRHLEFGSDGYWECYARHFTFTLFHASGTCRMGPKTDRYSVVDSRLRVHGVSGLRVIDASIMAQIISGHTAAPVYMIAEKGSDMIKEEWGVL